MHPCPKSIRHQLRRADSAGECVHLLRAFARSRRAHAHRVVARKLDVRALLDAAARSL